MKLHKNLSTQNLSQPTHLSIEIFHKVCSFKHFPAKLYSEFSYSNNHDVCSAKPKRDYREARHNFHSVMPNSLSLITITNQLISVVSWRTAVNVLMAFRAPDYDFCSIKMLTSFANHLWWIYKNNLQRRNIHRAQIIWNFFDWKFPQHHALFGNRDYVNKLALNFKKNMPVEIHENKNSINTS